MKKASAFVVSILITILMVPNVAMANDLTSPIGDESDISATSLNSLIANPVQNDNGETDFYPGDRITVTGTVQVDSGEQDMDIRLFTTDAGLIASEPAIHAVSSNVTNWSIGGVSLEEAGEFVAGYYYARSWYGDEIHGRADVPGFTVDAIPKYETIATLKAEQEVSTSGAIEVYFDPSENANSARFATAAQLYRVASDGALAPVGEAVYLPKGHLDTVRITARDAGSMPEGGVTESAVSGNTSESAVSGNGIYTYIVKLRYVNDTSADSPYVGAWSEASNEVTIEVAVPDPVYAYKAKSKDKAISVGFTSTSSAISSPYVTYEPLTDKQIEAFRDDFSSSVIAGFPLADVGLWDGDGTQLHPTDVKVSFNLNKLLPGAEAIFPENTDGDGDEPTSATYDGDEDPYGVDPEDEMPDDDAMYLAESNAYRIGGDLYVFDETTGGYAFYDEEEDEYYYYFPESDDYLYTYGGREGFYHENGDYYSYHAEENRYYNADRSDYFYYDEDEEIYYSADGAYFYFYDGTFSYEYGDGDYLYNGIKDIYVFNGRYYSYDDVKDLYYLDTEYENLHGLPVLLSEEESVDDEDSDGADEDSGEEDSDYDNEDNEDEDSDGGAEDSDDEEDSDYDYDDDEDFYDDSYDEDYGEDYDEETDDSYDGYYYDETMKSYSFNGKWYFYNEADRGYYFDRDLNLFTYYVDGRYFYYDYEEDTGFYFNEDGDRVFDVADSYDEANYPGAEDNTFDYSTNTKTGIYDAPGKSGQEKSLGEDYEAVVVDYLEIDGVKWAKAVVRETIEYGESVRKIYKDLVSDPDFESDYDYYYDSIFNYGSDSYEIGRIGYIELSDLTPDVDSWYHWTVRHKSGEAAETDEYESELKKNTITVTSKSLSPFVLAQEYHTYSVTGTAYAAPMQEEGASAPIPSAVPSDEASGSRGRGVLGRTDARDANVLAAHSRHAGLSAGRALPGDAGLVQRYDPPIKSGLIDGSKLPKAEPNPTPIPISARSALSVFVWVIVGVVAVVSIVAALLFRNRKRIKPEKAISNR
jgi:hypothetical protein